MNGMSTHDPKAKSFEVFASEVRHLEAVWTMWRRLYCRDDEPSAEAQVAAGNRAYQVTGAAAKSFFYYTRWQLLRGVVLDLCRLGDRLRTSGQDNLTVERIVGDAPSVTRQSDRLLEIEVDLLAEYVANMKPFRHKLVAHFDLDVATERAPVPSVPIDDIDRAVRLMSSITERVRCAWNGEPLGVDDAPPDSLREQRPRWRSEIDQLVHLLERGIQSARVEEPGLTP
jgi:hypothetical protein